LPYGIALGWVFGSLPMALVKNGFYPVPATLSVELGLSIYAWHLLFAPVVDLSLSLRRWYGIGLALAIVGILPFCWLSLKPETSDIMKALAGLSQVAALLILLAATGFMARHISPDRVGRAAGWYQAGILGGQGLALLCTSLLTGGVPWKIMFLVEAGLMMTGMLALFRLPAARPEKKATITQAAAQALADSRSWFRSSKGIFITLMALSPIGIGAATVGWNIGVRLYAIPENEMQLVIGPFSIVASLIGFLVGGWAADRFGKWRTWLRAATILALLALLIAFCPSIAWLFDAGVLLYAFFASICTAAFWAIILQAVSPTLVVTKITLLSLLTGVSMHYMRAFDGNICDDYSFQFMLIGEALVSLLAIGVALLLKRRLGIGEGSG
jgi:MFS transporter, PAT family, beta-lactamase induction signal transducer AmpG